MNYLQRNNRRKRSGITVMFAVLVVLVAVIFVVSPSLFPSFAHSVGSFFWTAESSNNVASVEPLFMSKRALLEENRRLTRELISARVDQLSFDIITHEIKVLKEQVGRIEEGDVLAAVVARPPRIPYDTVVIDAGLQEGVNVGDVARVGERMAIGEVTEVFERTSKVTLFSSPRSELEARLLPSDVTVLIIGQGAGGFFFELSREETVEEGDLLVLPGITQMLIAEVVSVYTPEGGAFHQVFARIPIDLSNLATLIITSRSMHEVIDNEE